MKLVRVVMLSISLSAILSCGNGVATLDPGSGNNARAVPVTGGNNNTNTLESNTNESRFYQSLLFVVKEEITGRVCPYTVVRRIPEYQAMRIAGTIVAKKAIDSNRIGGPTTIEHKVVVNTAQPAVIKFICNREGKIVRRLNTNRIGRNCVDVFCAGNKLKQYYT